MSAIDLATCARCGKRVVACRDAGCQALSERADRTPVADERKCDGCGLCAQVCPVWDCVRLEPVPGLA